MTIAPEAPHSRGTDESGALASVSKAVLLLEALNAADGPLGVSLLARRTGMPKSTAFRLLAHLETSGFVERSEKAYQLGRRLFEFGNHVEACRPRGLRDVALPHMVDLQQRSNATVHLAVLDGSDVVYLEKVHGLSSPASPTSIGARNPASCTAVGKLLLAFAEPDHLRAVLAAGLPRRTPFSVVQPGLLLQQLTAARRTGLAYDREEAQLGLSCVAAPIVRDARVVAALSMSAPTHPNTEESRAGQVGRAAASISRELNAG